MAGLSDTWSNFDVTGMLNTNNFGNTGANSVVFPTGGNAGANNGFFSGMKFGDLISAGTGILQGLAGLRQAQMAEQQLKLAKQQFGFQKGLANRNLANQAKLINNQYDSAAQVAAGMIGGVDANGNYGMTDKAIVDQYANAAKDKYVDGSAIG